MKLGLAGKTALITGGSRGIGAAIGRRFAAEGAHVAFTYVENTAAAKRTEAEIRALGVKPEAIRAEGGDLAAVRSAVGQAAAALGGLDILVHSAGVANYVAIDATDDADYLEVQRKHFSVNVTGVIAMTKAALPHLRDGGRIIVIGSVNAHQMPFPGGAIYGASKAAAPVWFALGQDRPLAFYAGIWTPWTSVRKLKEGRDNQRPLRLPHHGCKHRSGRDPSQGDAGHRANS